jgi:hypothetical protein
LPANNTILPANNTILPANNTILPANNTILPANNTRTDKIPLDSEALLQAVHFFCGVLLINEPTYNCWITPTKTEVDSPKALMTVSLPYSFFAFHFSPNLAFLNSNSERNPTKSSVMLG